MSNVTAAESALAQEKGSLSLGAKVLTGVLVLAGVVPAAYVGNVVAKWIARSTGFGGPGVAIVLVLLAGLILVGLGGIAIAVATQSSRVFRPLAGGALVVLAAASVDVRDARRGA